VQVRVYAQDAHSHLATQIRGKHRARPDGQKSAETFGMESPGGVRVPTHRSQAVRAHDSGNSGLFVFHKRTEQSSPIAWIAKPPVLPSPAISILFFCFPSSPQSAFVCANSSCVSSCEALAKQEALREAGSAADSFFASSPSVARALSSEALAKEDVSLREPRFFGLFRFRLREGRKPKDGSPLCVHSRSFAVHGFFAFLCAFAALCETGVSVFGSSLRRRVAA